MQAPLIRTFVLALILCGVIGDALAASSVNPMAEFRGSRSERVMKAEVERLLRKVAFNIVRMERGFTISIRRERMEFEHLETLGDEHKRYRISSARVNGVLEMKMEGGVFYDMTFWAPDEARPLEECTGKRERESSELAREYGVNGRRASGMKLTI